MPTVIDEHNQFIDNDGIPIVSGEIHIGAQNQDPVANHITIYSDRALTTPIANPQPTDATGRATNKIWVPGKYSIQVNDSADVQKHQDLDAGEITQTGVSLLINAQGADTVTAEGSPAILTLVDKQIYTLTAAAANTGPMTLQIDTTPSKSIKKAHDQAMAAGDVEAGQIMTVAYNATDDVYELLSSANSGAFDVVRDQYGDLRVQPGYFNGLTTSPNGSDSEHDIDIAPGECTDSTDTVYMRNTAAFTKRWDAAFAIGDDAGGMPAAVTPTTGDGVHMFLLGHTDGSVDAGWDTSTSATALLAAAQAIDSGWLYYRRIASFIPNADSPPNITGYSQRLREFLLLVPIASVNDTSPGVTANAYAMDVPTGIPVRALIAATQTHNTTNTQAIISSLDTTDTVPTASLYTMRTNGSAVHNTAYMSVRTNTDGEIRYRQNDVSADIDIITLGWVDDLEVF